MSYTVTKPVYLDVAPQAQRHTPSLMGLLSLWHFRWSSRRALRVMTDEGLADIGVSDAQARQEASKWFWQP